MNKSGKQTAHPSPSFWGKQRVLITGGAGFLGSFVVDALKACGTKKLFVPRSREYDLRDRVQIDRLLRETQPTLIIHLAAVCGGIGANQESPGRFFYDNAIIGIQLMESARTHKVQKFVQVGTVCAYPKTPPHIPFREEDLWMGYPEETNAPYGLAKKMLLVQAQAYRQQYGFNAIYLLPANLYGPRDHFDLKNSHVIPALVRKIIDAKTQGNKNVEIWGTGKPTREFLYVEDAARGILLASEHYNAPEPVNLGSGKSVTIRYLAETICKLLKFKGRLVWNTKKPDGQPRRGLDTRRAAKAFGFRSNTALEKGLKNTIAWYLKYGDESFIEKSHSNQNATPHKKEILKHPDSGVPMAIVIRYGFKDQKYNFFTPGEYALQMGINHYAQGEKIQPHIHPPFLREITSTQECLVIRRGHVRMRLFDDAQREVLATELHEGDIVLLISGGHGFEILEDTEIFEVKQGPYAGDTDKVRFSFAASV